MIRFLFGLMPGWGYALLIGAALATATGWHLKEVAQARKEGRGEVQARWDAAEKLRAEAEAKQRIERAAQAMSEAKAHEAAKAAIARTLTQTRDALRYALRTPISCPVGGDMPLADVRIPAAALVSLRTAAGAGQPTD